MASLCYEGFWSPSSGSVGKPHDRGTAQRWDPQQPSEVLTTEIAAPCAVQLRTGENAPPPAPLRWAERGEVPLQLALGTGGRLQRHRLGPWGRPPRHPPSSTTSCLRGPLDPVVRSFQISAVGFCAALRGFGFSRFGRTRVLSPQSLYVLSLLLTCLRTLFAEDLNVTPEGRNVESGVTYCVLPAVRAHGARLHGLLA